MLPDRELACAPYDSPEGRAYFGAMCAAANFAFANRQVITHAIRQVFARHLGAELRLVYDVAHMAKLEEHGGEQLLVHRKGATRAFGPAHPETPAAYRGVGQPVLIPGSMGTASYVLVGTDEALALSFGSTCHGELAEEAPYAYKDIDRVVDVVHRAGLARPVARLVPLGVVKG